MDQHGYILQRTGGHVRDDNHDPGSRTVLRRTLLGLLGLAGVGVVGGRLLTHTSDPPHPGAATREGLHPLRNAMHVHTSFSEGGGSLQGQLEEAKANDFDVLWPTDHDWRMSAFDAPTEFHFTGTSETVGDLEYTWVRSTTGSPLSSSGDIVSDPTSPHDTAAAKGSLMLTVTSSGETADSCRYRLDGSAANLSQRTNLLGQTIVVDVRPELVDEDAWAEVLVTMSYRPETAGRPAGSYQLSYRLGVAGPDRSAADLRGIVNVPVPAGQFTTVTLDPVSDASVLWPELDATDNSLVDLDLGVTARRGARARAHFGHLRFTRRATVGDQPLRTQADMVRRYAPAYDGLSIQRGVEVSGPSEHASWFGGEQHLIDHATFSTDDVVASAAELIHSGGGLASLNHPFGSANDALLPQSAQDERRRQVARDFLDRDLCGVDIVEVGYRQRQGMSLESHLALYDTFVRNGFWVTATGVNDNHGARTGSWATEPNRFYSTCWARSTSEDDLLQSLRAGRVFVGELGSFDGFLDLDVDGVPMGSVTVDAGARSRTVSITASSLPAGYKVEVVRGEVDHADEVEPGSSVIRTLEAGDFTDDLARLSLDTSRSCFVRVAVLDGRGRRVAFTNPVVVLRSPPPRKVPAARRA